MNVAEFHRNVNKESEQAQTGKGAVENKDAEVTVNCFFFSPSHCTFKGAILHLTQYTNIINGRELFLRANVVVDSAKYKKKKKKEKPCNLPAVHFLNFVPFSGVQVSGSLRPFYNSCYLILQKKS